MTTLWREFVECPNCQCRVSTEAPFNAWVREHPRLDSRDDCIVATDADLIVHRYGTRRDEYGIDRSVQYLMQIEVKTFGRDLTDSQRETLRLHAMNLRTVTHSVERNSVGRFELGHRSNYRPSFVNGSHIMHYGVHLLQLGNSTPDNSDWMRWDHKPVDLDTLVALLRFELSPDSLRPINEEHRKKRKRQLTLPLFAGFGDSGD